ncbi:hypothetical protein AND_005584 [Anopheles darlingi]|uniref:Ig-like domain-containing protein n=1 Tax=Anopheles darlingi TaxID=43151 RepID=W5JED1_ANODA|nr:hypothetical protein AND_005584 [Anopheles darlingi]
MVSSGAVVPRKLAKMELATDYEAQCGVGPGSCDSHGPKLIGIGHPDTRSSGKRSRNEKCSCQEHVEYNMVATGGVPERRPEGAARSRKGDGAVPVPVERAFRRTNQIRDQVHPKQSHMHENAADFNNEASFPRFAEPIPNITVTIGRDALLACVVDNLKGYKQHLKLAAVRVPQQRVKMIRCLSDLGISAINQRADKQQTVNSKPVGREVLPLPLTPTDPLPAALVLVAAAATAFQSRQRERGPHGTARLAAGHGHFAIQTMERLVNRFGEGANVGDELIDVDGRCSDETSMDMATGNLCRSIRKQNASLERPPLLRSIHHSNRGRGSATQPQVDNDIDRSGETVAGHRRLTSASPERALRYVREASGIEEPLDDDDDDDYPVAWVRVDTQTILSIHHNVITQNPRISLTYNDHRSWYLHIREVEENDRGWYMCQVNTDPMRSRKGYLQVVVPPAIVESLTSNDMVVREGTNVTLNCKAKGFPEPYVMWRREDGDEMAIGGESVNVVDGETLHITKVSRLHMAAYLCVASNGVPPSISKRVQLRVQFPPMLSIPNQLEGAYVGQDVVLECHTEAYPASINYWTTERGDMIISADPTGDIEQDQHGHCHGHGL